MALDCVSAAINTLVPSQFSTEAIADLVSKGHRSDAKKMRHINYVVKAVDVGGAVAGDTSLPQKRKSTPTKGNNNKKKTSGSTKKKRQGARRSRFRLHRTNVAKRVTRMAATILKQKADYLSRCHYVGLILDEGNNFSGSCPLYVSTISCDPEFNWRVMFIGQADSTGRKDGKSIFDMTKQIFIDAGMETVYKKIVSGGTDGAPVMRSTPLYSGESIIQS